MTWGFIWLMFVLKIPILMLFALVWWAVRQQEDPAAEGDGGTKVRPRPHPPRRPRHRRPRGPHSTGALLPPPRVRPVRAIARESAAARHRETRT